MVEPFPNLTITTINYKSSLVLSRYYAPRTQVVNNPLNCIQCSFTNDELSSKAVNSNVMLLFSFSGRCPARYRTYHNHLVPGSRPMIVCIRFYNGRMKTTVSMARPSYRRTDNKLIQLILLLGLGPV